MSKAAYSLAIALLLAGCYRVTPATLTVKGAPDVVEAFVAESGAADDFRIETRKVGDQETAIFTAKTGGADSAMSLMKEATGRRLSVEYKAPSSALSLTFVRP
jgi:hypothetical protein